MKQNAHFVAIIALSMVILGCIQGHCQTRNPSYEAYISKYKDLAIQQQKLYKIPASITLAQGLLETGAGTSRLARIGNNHFGIKCKEEWTGGTMYVTDDAPNECFRTYKSVEDSYLDHSLFLAKRKYYVSLFDLNLYDYPGWAYGLQRCGYATDKFYGQKLVNIIETYELHKYDKMQPIGNTSKNDDIYEIKIATSEFELQHPEFRKWRRNIYEVNGIHYLKAQTGDTYETISKDIRMKLKKLHKFNEVTAGHRLSTGDIVFLQPKKKQASKDNSVHKVRPGESLYDVSQLYGMKIKSIYKFNKLSDDHVLKPGDALKVRK